MWIIEGVPSSTVFCYKIFMMPVIFLSLGFMTLGMAVPLTGIVRVCHKTLILQ